MRLSCRSVISVEGACLTGSGGMHYDWALVAPAILEREEETSAGL